MKPRRWEVVVATAMFFASLWLVWLNRTVNRFDGAALPAVLTAVAAVLVVVACARAESRR